MSCASSATWKLKFSLIQSTQKDISDVKMSEELSDESSDNLSDSRSSEKTSVSEEGRTGRWLRRGSTTPPPPLSGSCFCLYLCVCTCLLAKYFTNHETSFNKTYRNYRLYIYMIYFGLGLFPNGCCKRNGSNSVVHRFSLKVWWSRSRNCDLTRRLSANKFCKIRLFEVNFQSVSKIHIYNVYTLIIVAFFSFACTELATKKNKKKPFVHFCAKNL